MCYAELLPNVNQMDCFDAVIPRCGGSELEATGVIQEAKATHLIRERMSQAPALVAAVDFLHLR